MAAHANQACLLAYLLKDAFMKLTTYLSTKQYPTAKKMICGMLVVVTAACLCAGRQSVSTADTNTTQGRMRKIGQLLEAGQNEKAKILLDEWKRLSPYDADLYVLYANYYLNLSESDGVHIDPQPPKGEYILGPGQNSGQFAIVDPKTSRTVSVIDTSNGLGCDELVSRSLELLREAHRRYPERLDISFSVVDLLEGGDDFGGYCSLLNEIGAYASAHPDRLFWGSAKLPEPPDQFVPKRFHHYTIKWLRESGGENQVLKLAELAIRYYPKHPYAYNDIAVLYVKRRDTKNALVWMTKAFQVDPTDALVARNIAMQYESLHDTENARRFNQIVLQLDTTDEQIKLEARNALQKLNAVPAKGKKLRKQ